MAEDRDTSFSESYEQLRQTYPHLHHSGAIPSHAEHHTIASARQSLQKRVLGLQKELEALKRRTAEIEAELLSMPNQLVAHGVFISPLRRIPQEILRDIFAYTIPSFGVPIQYMTFATPWTLLRVCKHWHDTCLAYGSLWARITLDRETYDLGSELPPNLTMMPSERVAEIHAAVTQSLSARRVAKAVELLELQLLRSRDADLVIHIDGVSYHAYGQPFLRILLSHAHRWSRITIPYHILAHTPLPSNLIRLTHVCLTNRDFINHLSDAHSLDIPTESPFSSAWVQAMETVATLKQGRGTYVVADGLFVADFVDHPRAWHRPEVLSELSLDVTTCQPEEVLHLLGMSEGLVELQLTSRLHDTWSLEGQPATAPDVPLPKLERLIIGAGFDVVFASIIRTLRAPRLVDLTYGGHLIPDALVSFLTKSDAHLRDFTLQTHHVNSESLQRLFTIAPIIWQWLEDLHVEVSFPMDEAAVNTLIDILTISPSPFLARTGSDAATSNIFPSLSHLRIGHETASVSQVVDMIESRRMLPADAIPPAHSSRLVSCDVSTLWSRKRRPYPKSVDMEWRREMLSYIYKEEHMRSGSSHIVWSMDSEFTSHWLYPPTTRIPRFWWSEELEMESECMDRMRKLEEDGLELFMSRSSFEEVDFENDG